MTHANPCVCGRPIPDTANLCRDCGGDLRRNLYKIADRWAELEDALSWREVHTGTIGVVDTAPTDRAAGELRLPIVTGTGLNEAAVRARRKATDAVWFALQVTREDHDNNGWTFAPPKVVGGDRTQDQTPALARWLAATQVDHIVRRTDRRTAEEISRDVAAAETAVFKATHPSGIHWAPVNLRCDQHATAEDGSRTLCPGSMYALIGTGVMPDLVCDTDPEHTIDPGKWERSGWKRRLRHEDGVANGAARLVRKIRG